MEENWIDSSNNGSWNGDENEAVNRKNSEATNSGIKDSYDRNGDQSLKQHRNRTYIYSSGIYEGTIYIS